MIRVLHYGMSPNLGGIETYLLNLARTVDASRFQFDFVYSDYGQLPVFAPDLPNSRFFGVTPRRVNPQRNRGDLDALFALDEFDILHFHAVTASYVAPLRRALRAGVPVLAHSHGSGASSSVKTRILHEWNRRHIPWRQITRLAVSAEAGRWMFGGAPFEVLHNGIQLNAFTFVPAQRAAIRASATIGQDAFVLGHVGALRAVKNHTFVLEVFVEILRHRPDAMLFLVGDGPEEERVHRLVRTQNLTEKVRFLGRRSDVAALMAAMDCLMLPSLHEGFPTVVLEAQASGLPCWVSDHVTGEVVITPHCHRRPLDSPAAWAEAMLATTPPTDRQVGRQLLRDAGVSVQTNTARVMTLYEELLR